MYGFVDCFVGGEGGDVDCEGLIMGWIGDYMFFCLGLVWCDRLVLQRFSLSVLLLLLGEMIFVRCL